MTYKEQMRSPQWIKFATEFKTLHGWKCDACQAPQSPENELSVHHIYYMSGVMMWDHPSSILECLCLKCHRSRQALQQQEILEFAKSLKGKIYIPQFKSPELPKIKRNYTDNQIKLLWEGAIFFFKNSMPEHAFLLEHPRMDWLRLTDDPHAGRILSLVMNPDFTDGIHHLFSDSVSSELRRCISEAFGCAMDFDIKGIPYDLQIQLGLIKAPSLD